ncbi:MAG: tetratricopeptide repeat protein [Rhizobiaceae bacterium]|nr:tetratricopeptide repeat protein [Rhizobiaceae bacterium]
MHTHVKALFISVSLGLPLLGAPAFAVGDGGASDTPTCPKGKAYDKKSGTCKDAQRGALDDDSLYEYGRSLAHQGRYGEAITILGLAADKTDPRILNYLGYSHRKAGRVTVALGYYEEALRQNPDYTLAREYLGEAYLQRGDVDAARSQLSEIEKRAGSESPEYVLLSEQIESYLKG